MLKSLKLAWALFCDWLTSEPEARPEIPPPPPESWEEETLVSEGGERSAAEKLR